MTVLESLVVGCAQILPMVVAGVGIGVWVLLPRHRKGRFAVASIVALCLTAAMVLLAGLVYDDPRPFVADPGHPALFWHAADNGFPSDHTAYAATVALLVALVKRAVGVLLVGLSVAAGVARVLANVHHVQDVVGGLLIAVASVALTGQLVYQAWGARISASDM